MKVLARCCAGAAVALGVVWALAAILAAQLGPVGATLVLAFVLASVFVTVVLWLLAALDRWPASTAAARAVERTPPAQLDPVRTAALTELADAYLDWRTAHPARRDSPAA